MKLETKISNIIKDRTGVCVFSKNRKQDTVDVRGLFDYVLRKEYNYTLQSIADYYVKNGKKRSHDVVLYSVNNYQNEIQNRRKDLKDLHTFISDIYLSSKQYTSIADALKYIKHPEELEVIKRYLKKLKIKRELEANKV